MNDISSFLDYIRLELSYSDKTINSYKQDLESFETYLSTVGETFESVNPQIIRTYLSKQLAEGKTKVTCCRRISGLRLFYSWLVKNQKVKTNPFLLIGAPKKEIRYPEALYLEQIEELLRKTNKEKTNLNIVIKQ